MMSSLLRALWRDESGGSGVGRLGIGLAGAAVGFAIGGPFGAAAFGAQLGFLGGSILGNIIFPQNLPDVQGARLDPNQMMTSAYGDPIKFGLGRFVVAGTLAYYPGFDEHEINQEIGGKGAQTGSAKSYTYTGNFRVNFCEGPVDAILKIWANRVLIYDATNTTQPLVDAERIRKAPGVNALRLYLGTEDQRPDVKQLELEGVGNASAYRGIVGAFFQNYPLDDTGGVPPQVTALIATGATEIFPSTLLDNIPYNGSRWAWQPGRSTFLIRGPNTTRVNNITQTVMTSGVILGQTGFPAVDGEGNFYTLGANQWRKYSGETLQLVWESDIYYPASNCATPFSGSLNWANGRMFGGIKTPVGLLVGELMFHVRQTLGSTQEVVVLDPMRFDEDCGGVVNTYFMPTSSSEILTVDGERHLWLMSNETGETVLRRIEPGAGEISETWTLAGETYSAFCYDPHTNSLILGDPSSHIARWSLDTHIETGRISDITFVDQGSKNQGTWWNGPSFDGKLYLQTGSTLGQWQEFDIHEMEAGNTWRPDADFGLESSSIHVRGIYDESRRALVVRHDTGQKIYWCYLDRKTGVLITVKQIVDLIASKVRLLASKMDSTNLTQQLHGYLIGQRTQGNRAIEPLMPLFFFNPIIEDFIVKFPLLGTSSVATIPEDDLAAGDGDEPRVSVDRLTEEMLQEIELPELLELGYANEQAEYQVQVQRVKRPRSTTNTRRRRLLAFPGTFVSNSDAKQRLETALYNIWSKRLPVIFRTAQRWSRLSPADVVTVESEGLSREVILGQVDHGANNMIEFAGAADDPSVLTSIAVGAEGIIPEQEILLTAPSEYFVADIPLLRSQDKGFGVYLAGGPFGDADFRGEEIRRGIDGTTFGSFAFISSSRAASHGFTTTIPGDANPDFWDRDTSFNVTLSRGALSSSTEAAVIDGANAILVGNELMNFVTAVDNGNKNYTVSTLLRGRKGTEGEIGLHVANEKVLVIDEDTVQRKGLDLVDLGVPYYYKGITRGGTLADGIRRLITVQGKSEWTWAPAHVAGSISADDWTIGWKWRNFLVPQWKNLLAVPHLTGWDYEVDVLSGPGGAVVATYDTTATANGSVIDANAHSFFYDDADQIVDFESVQTMITIKIYPMVENIGRGFPKEATLVGG